jgi:hypothetical protein
MMNLTIRLNDAFPSACPLLYGYGRSIVGGIPVRHIVTFRIPGIRHMEHIIARLASTVFFVNSLSANYCSAC